MHIPFHKPILPNPKQIGKFLSESLDTGWLTTGPKVKQFEEKLQAYLNSNYVVCTNSCTAALHLVLAAKNITRDDHFMVPTFTFVASVEVGEYFNSKPILIDSELNGFNMDLNRVEDELKRNNKVKVIIPVHYGGQAVDIKELRYICDQYGVFILEDAAHALESVSSYGKVGNTSDAACFSFYANKNITTGGEGGAVSTNNNKLAEKIRRLSLHGINKSTWSREQVRKNKFYDVVELGYKYNMNDISGSIGLHQFEYISTWHLRRIKIAKMYLNKLSNIEGFIMPLNENIDKHAWHLFVIRMLLDKWQVNRNEIMDLLRQQGVETSVHYIPIHMQSYFKNKYNYTDQQFPNSHQLSQSVISLPIYPDLNDKQVHYIIDVLIQLWTQFSK